MSARPSVSIVRLGCARNDVDAEELAGRLIQDGFRIVADARRADAVLVNTCAFVAAAKKDSVDAVLEAAGSGVPVVAVGCLAERYGAQLAAALPEASAVLGFDDYATIGTRVDEVLRGHVPPAPVPRDRRTLLPISPASRGAPAPAQRHRLTGSVSAPIKLASGCDRRCSFCAIPRYRGAFVSRPPEEVLADAEWLAAAGVRELVLVSENSTSYGKDFGRLGALEELLPELVAVPGVVRVRVAYLQPAEVRPGLVETLATTGGVASYFDLSFQHASGPVLRRMRRFGDRVRFLDLLAAIRGWDGQAGARSNVIVGFPGETRADVAELERFLTAARLDAVGVFGYSDEDGTAAASLDGKVGAVTVRRRVDRVERLVEELTAQRALERVGTEVDVLIEGTRGRVRAEGRAAHQGPESDGSCVVRGAGLRAGDLVRAQVVSASGVDLVADAVQVLDRAPVAPAEEPS
ncbi:MAG: MiaB/RimO family radical SAM methylthiotransferase [Mycobacteriales bacterium]